MDGIDSNGAEILVFAATNMPWGVDPAFRRPGRFDRLLFVTPPDELSKTELFRRFLADLPGGSAIDAAALAKSSPLLTGADIKGLCERSAERALLRSIESNQVHPVSLTDVQEQLRRTTSSAAEWLATARNYARYSNEGGQYDELVSYLKKVKMY
jgi:SpoVK/Ycf46/Vps4 family AAA+-type ATPase